MKYRVVAKLEPALKYCKTYCDATRHIYKLLKNKDNKFNQFAEIFLDNIREWGIRSFQSFDGCAFVETILLFH
jgi:hypothetical protein